MADETNRRRPLPRAFWILWCGALLNRIGDFVQFFLAIYLTTARGLSPAQVGAVLSLWGLGTIGAGPVGGVLADRFGRRPTLLLALVLGASTMLLLGFARSLPQITVAAALVGFCGQLYRPAQQAAIADLISPDDRARAFSLIYWAINLGFSCAAVLAGLLAKFSYSLMFVVDAATTLGYALVVLVLFREPQRGEGQPRSWLRDLAYPFRDRVMLALLGICLCVALVFVQISCTLPLETARHGISADSFGRLLAINGVMIVALQLWVGRVIDRVRPARMLAVSSLLIGVGFGVYAFAGGWPVFAGGIVIWTLGEMTLNPVVASVIAALAPADRRGAYQGAYNLVFATASAVAPLLGGEVLERFGQQVLWGGSLVLCALAALGHLVLGGAERRRVRVRES